MANNSKKQNNSIYITVINQDYREIFQDSINPNLTNTIKTKWIQGAINQPSATIFEIDGKQYSIELEYKETESKKKVLMGVDTFANYHVKTLFSYGTDDTRPSYCGTISFKPVKENK